MRLRRNGYVIRDDGRRCAALRDQGLSKRANGPRLFVIKVKAETLPRSLPSRDAVFIKNRFRAHLGLAAG